MNLYVCVTVLYMCVRVLYVCVWVYCTCVDRPVSQLTCSFSTLLRWRCVLRTRHWSGSWWISTMASRSSSLSCQRKRRNQRGKRRSQRRKSAGTQGVKQGPVAIIQARVKSASRPVYPRVWPRLLLLLYPEGFAAEGAQYLNPSNCINSDNKCQCQGNWRLPSLFPMSFTVQSHHGCIDKTLTQP